MFGAIPLLIVPFVLYNLGLLGIFGSGDDPWMTEMFSIRMMSGGVFSMTLGDLMVLIGLIFLFIEISKSVRTTSASISWIISCRRWSSSPSWSNSCW